MADSRESKLGQEFLKVTGQSTAGKLTTLQQHAIDRVCMIFEEHWGDGAHSIEKLLEQHPELCQTTLLENLVAIEFELCWSAGQTPDLHPYLNRFSTQQPLVTRVFEQVKLEMVDSAQRTTIMNSSETLKVDSNEPSSWPSITGYEVIAELGRGGMGVVYRARQLTLNREVALKVIARDRHEDVSRRERFKREGEIVATFTHPNIAHVYDAGESNGLSYFASELIEGGTLADISTPLEPNEALQFMTTVADAVAVAHASGVVHCDLKPANILLSIAADGISIGNQTVVPKIADFGLASSLHVQAVTAEGLCGTPDFMAPEQVETKETVTRATDVHALGLILYQLLTGLNPYQAETVELTLNRVRHHIPESPGLLNPKVSQASADICLKCLKKNPTERFGTAGELAAALRQAMDSDTDTKLSRRWMVLASLAGAAALAFGLRRAFKSTDSTKSDTAKVDSAKADSQHTSITEIILDSPDSWLIARIDDKEVHVDKAVQARVNRTQIVRVRLPRHVKLLQHHRDELGGWTSLLTLEAAHSPFSDNDAQILTKLTLLESIDLFGTAVTGRSIETMAGLKNLSYLSVGQTAIKTPDIAGLGHLPIKTLNLTGANFDEPNAAQNLRRLKTLRTLQLVYCSVEQLEAAVHIMGLVELRIFPGLFTDRAIKAIGQLTVLESLDMTVEQQLDGAIDFSGLKSLRQLMLRFNQTHEQIPDLILPKSLRVLTILGNVDMDYDQWARRYPTIEIHHRGRLVNGT